MNCPHCGSAKFSTKETRSTPAAIRRRRACSQCKRRFTTYEVHDSTLQAQIVLESSIEAVQHHLRLALARLPMPQPDRSRITNKLAPVETIHEAAE